jgi:hypothetical protein
MQISDSLYSRLQYRTGARPAAAPTALRCSGPARAAAPPAEAPEPVGLTAAAAADPASDEARVRAALRGPEGRRWLPPAAPPVSQAPRAAIRPGEDMSGPPPVSLSDRYARKAGR